MRECYDTAIEDPTIHPLTDFISRLFLQSNLFAGSLPTTQTLGLSNTVAEQYCSLDSHVDQLIGY
jgi:hypothetical protein